MTESKPIETELTTEGRLTSLRASGWTVAVHNDYRLNGTAYTFWLFTRGNDCAKGEGLNDEQAISRAYDSVLWLDERRANAIESARAGFIPAATLTSERAQWAKEREGLEEKAKSPAWARRLIGELCSKDLAHVEPPGVLFQDAIEGLRAFKLSSDEYRKQCLAAESRATSAERESKALRDAAWFVKQEVGLGNIPIPGSSGGAIALGNLCRAVDALATPPAVKESTKLPCGLCYKTRDGRNATCPEHGDNRPGQGRCEPHPATSDSEKAPVKLATDVPTPPPITPEDIERINREGREWSAEFRKKVRAMENVGPVLSATPDALVEPLRTARLDPSRVESQTGSAELRSMIPQSVPPFVPSPQPEPGGTAGEANSTAAKETP